jgi:hypothetical protein
VHTGFWYGNLRERDHLKHTGINERIILKGYSRNRMRAWTSFVWLRIGTGGRLF